MKTIICQYDFMNSQPDKNGLPPAHKLFNRPFLTNLPSATPQPKPSTTNTATETETLNCLSTIAPNDHPRSYNVLNERGNLINRTRRHLISTNEKFIVKHNYDDIIEPRETAPQKTLVQTKSDIPSNSTTPPVRTKSGRISKKQKKYLEEC